MKPKKSYIKNSFWLLLSNIIKSVGGLTIGVWVANHLGKSDYGMISYAVAYFGAFTFLVEIGLQNILVKEIINNPNDEDIYINSSILLKLFGSLIAIITSSIVAYFTVDDPLTFKMILVMGINYLFLSVSSVDAYFKAHVISKYRVIATSLAYFANLAVKVYLILNNSSTFYFIFSYSIDFLLAGVFRLVVYKVKKKNLKYTFSTKVAKQLLAASWTIGLAAFLSRFLSRIDRIMIGNMLTDADVGLYSVSTDLANPLKQFAAIITASMVPYLISLKKEKPDIYLKRIGQILNLFTWSLILFCGSLVLMSEFIYSTVYSEEYLFAAIPFSINAWNLLFVFQVAIINIWLINENLQKYQLITTIIAVIINLIGNYLLIQIMGIVGAAISTVLSRLLTVWILPLFIKELRGITMITLKSLNPFSIPKSINAFIK